MTTLRITLLGLFTCLLSLSSLAQVKVAAEPAVTGGAIDPAPIPGGVGAPFSISFTIGNKGNAPITGENKANQMEFGICLGKCAPATGEADALASLSGDNLTYFNVRFVGGCYEGRQKTAVAIPPNTVFGLTVRAVVTVASSSTAVNDIGASCNIAPNPTANPQPTEDDFLSVYTHTTSTGFAITGVTTVSCTNLGAGERTLTFTPQYSGLNGQPVSFSVVNELGPTTAPGPYTLRLFTKNPSITLKAQQTGSPEPASFAYNWVAACGSSGAPRRGVPLEPTVLLEVKLLGNPVHNSIKVDVMGAEHNFLQLSLYDMLGCLVGESHTLRAGTIEHYQFDVSAQPAGHLLLRVSSRGQSKAVRIVKLD